MAHDISPRRLFLWPSKLASLALRNPGRQLGPKRCSCTRTLSRSTDTAADHNKNSPMEQPFCGVLNSLAILATPRLGALYTAMRAAHCRGQAMGSPIYTSS